MKLHGAITINGKKFEKGDEISGWAIYPFFLFHMGMFGGSGFWMAYFTDDVETSFLYAHGGIAILVYSIFYLAIFGLDQVKWMFINAALGIFGVWAEVDILLGLAGKSLGDFPFYIHVTPFLYYILYTFLIRQALLDMFGARDDENRRRWVEKLYIVASLGIYGVLYLQ